MNAFSKITLSAACVLAAFTGMTLTRDAQAQRYGGRNDEVYCASNDGRGSRCQMPWRDSVLSQQMSSASCIEGRTWGSDPYSVWIKGGCRGNFRDARGGFGGGGGNRGDNGFSGGNGFGRGGGWDSRDRGPGREIYCASNDNRGARCQMPWRYSELSRQMSSSACIEGRTWGSDPFSVWVKNGCRAQFVEARGGRRW
ncbi:DUF3011 domain-containing protein [Dyella sp.]|uniref:DUF3011 domain-containing protein n=1 Tax=Dyella sp. TaxID=1869338 RepID=UPI002ED4B82F